MTPSRHPRYKLKPEARATIRTALLTGTHPLKVCVDHSASWATVLRIQREIKLELKQTPEMAAMFPAK